MLGVGLDDLVRRDAQRRARAARNWVAASATITASMAFAAAYSINQRNEAQVMRGKAETLIEFMLSDLSDRLEPVGKLDILQAVGGEVLDYYADQDLKSLDPAALSRRAQALMKLGQVDERRGDLDAALKAYEAAFASTEEQLRRAPSDPDRVFDHAQSVFYVGNVALIRGDYNEGEARFQQYFDMAQTLVEFDKVNPKWRLEVSYSANNLGALAFNRAKYAASIPYFEKAVETRRELAGESPDDRKFKLAYASALSWLAYAQIAVGENGNALDQLNKEIAIYESLDASASSEDFLALEKRITAERRVSVAQLSLGNVVEAKFALDRAERIGEMLVGREPDNLLALNNIAITQRLQSNLSGLSGDKRSALTEAERALSAARAVAKRDKSQVAFKANLGYALAQRIIIEPESAASALEELDTLLRDPSIGSTGNDPEFRVRAGLAQAVHARSIGRAEDAKRLASQTLAAVEVGSFQLTVEAQRTLALLLAESGDRDGSSQICDQLLAKGIRHPELLALQKGLRNDRVTSRP
ncbi:MAG: tetratricopeptide repeat protein [Parvularculaceae bacterium]